MTTKLESESDLGENIHILGNLPLSAYIRLVPDQLEDLEKRRYSKQSDCWETAITRSYSRLPTISSGAR